MNSRAERVYNAFLDLEPGERASVISRIKKDEKFARNLNALADIIKEHGPEAAGCVMRGDLEGAKAAALKNANAKGK